MQRDEDERRQAGDRREPQAAARPYAEDERRAERRVDHRRRADERQAEAEQPFEEDVVRMIPHPVDSGAIGIAVGGKDIGKGAQTGAERPVVGDRRDCRVEDAPSRILGGERLSAMFASLGKQHEQANDQRQRRQGDRGAPSTGEHPFALPA